MTGVVMKKITPMYIWGAIGVFGIMGIVGLTIPWNFLDILITLMATHAILVNLRKRPTPLIDIAESTLAFAAYNMLPLRHAQYANGLVISEKPGSAFYGLLVAIAIFVIVEGLIRNRKRPKADSADEFKEIIDPFRQYANTALMQINQGGELGEKTAQFLADALVRIREGGLCAEIKRLTKCPEEDILQFFSLGGKDWLIAVQQPDVVQWSNVKKADEQISIIDSIALILSLDQRLSANQVG